MSNSPSTVAPHRFVEPHPEACEKCGRAESDPVHDRRIASGGPGQFESLPPHLKYALQPPSGVDVFGECEWWRIKAEEFAAELRAIKS